MSTEINYSEVTPAIVELSTKCQDNIISPDLFSKYEVNRGLRDLNGKGVLTGLTEISDIQAKKIINGKELPCEGKLYYRGIDVDDIVSGFMKEKRFGFEETIYLLIFGNLPTSKELTDFSSVLNTYCSLPPKFVRDNIMKAPSSDMMNALARSVLTLYYYDENADDLSIPNVLRQCIKLIAEFPLLAVYGYQAYNHYERDQSLIIHSPNPEFSIAENILQLLRPDQQFTDLEARILDLALVLHAEHGGGNNSSFTVHVVTSSGTDTYSAIAAALGSLKGPKHGGANLRVMGMMKEMKEYVSDWNDDEQISAYLLKLLRKEAYDKSGLIYGMGHAIYSLSDPRAKIFESFVQKLSAAKGREKEYNLYTKVTKLAPEIIAKERQIYKGVSPNIDFFSGFVYEMLDLPVELYTPLFAISRIAGWSAHRIEELVNSSKIIRPAYKSVLSHRKYVPINDR
jgi:Citrate synthase